MTEECARPDRRRALIATALLGTGLAAPFGAPASAAPNRRSSAKGATCSTPCSAIVRTQYGPVRGYVSGDVFTFKGIPYGADTGGENRCFRPSRPNAGRTSITRSLMARTARRRCTASGRKSIDCRMADDPHGGVRRLLMA